MNESSTAAGVVNITELVDNQKLGSFFWNIMAWCLLVSLGDGYDYTAMAFAAPAVIKDMHVEPGALGSVFGAGLVGIMLGSIIFGYVGDRLGRKRAIVIGCLYFGALTFLTMFARSLDGLLWMRFIAGIGIGGAIPNAIALINEYSPRRYRATMVTVMFIGFLLGSGGGGYVAAGLVPSFGWPSVFFVGGVVPFLTGLACIRTLPESIRLLAAQNKDRAQIMALATRLQPGIVIGPETKFVLSEEPRPQRFSIALLFSGDRWMATPLLWLLYIANSLALFFLASWMPVLLESAGLPGRACSACWIAVFDRRDDWQSGDNALHRPIWCDRCRPPAADRCPSRRRARYPRDGRGAVAHGGIDCRSLYRRRAVRDPQRRRHVLPGFIPGQRRRLGALGGEGRLDRRPGDRGNAALGSPATAGFVHHRCDPADCRLRELHSAWLGLSYAVHGARGET